MIFHDGWYYLLVTHGSCCAGANSSYNIRMGRAKKRDRPVPRQHGRRHAQGRRQAVPRIGRPLRRARDISGCSTWATACRSSPATTRPTSIAAASACSTSGRCSGVTAGRWRARTSKAGTYEIESARTGTALELAVQGVPVGGLRGRGGRGGPAGWSSRWTRRAAGRAGRGEGPAPSAPPPAPIPPQEAAQVSANWPAATLDVRLAPYMVQAQQKWAIAPAPNAGGYPGSPYFKITVAGTDRALAATAERELVVATSFTGAPEQLWRIDQLADGTYRLMPKASAGLEGTGRALRGRQQHADALEVRPAERPSALEPQDAVTSFITRCRRGLPPLLACSALWLHRAGAPERRAGCPAPNGRVAAAGIVAEQAGDPDQGGRRRRVHPALAGPRADPRARPTHPAGRAAAQWRRTSPFRGAACRTTARR